MHVTGVIGPLGPILVFVVAPSVPRQLALKAAGKPVPAATTVNLLIDTGASGTAIDNTVIAALGLTPTGMTTFHTPSTGSTPAICPMYDVEIAIKGYASAGIHTVASLPVMGANFAAQGIGGLAGRDLLARGRLIYSGIDNMVMLSL